jgi:hypothetical protein
LDKLLIEKKAADEAKKAAETAKQALVEAQNKEKAAAEAAK